jgi:hypothetical protein
MKWKRGSRPLLVRATARGVNRKSACAVRETGGERAVDYNATASGSRNSFDHAASVAAPRKFDGQLLPSLVHQKNGLK